MRINPITSNTNQNFKAEIIETPELQKAIKMVEEYVRTSRQKDLDFAKDFIDSLRIIKASRSIDTFEIGVDRRRKNYTYTKINGKRLYGGANESQLNLRDEYLVVEGCKKFAARLSDVKATNLDTLKNEINKAAEKLAELKEEYAREVKIQLDNLFLG